MNELAGASKNYGSQLQVLIKYHYILLAKLKSRSEKWMRATLLLIIAHAVMRSKNALILGTLYHTEQLFSSVTFMLKSGQRQQLQYWKTHI